MLFIYLTEFSFMTKKTT